MPNITSGTRVPHGTARQDASTSVLASASVSSSRTQKGHANHGNHGHHGKHGKHGHGRASDTNTASSLKFSNWRARQSDDSTVAGPSSLRSSRAHVDDDLTTHGRVSRQGSSGSSSFSFEVLRRSSLLKRYNGQMVNLFELRSSNRDSSASFKGKETCTLTPASSAGSSEDAASGQMISRKQSITLDESQREQLLHALYDRRAAEARSLHSSLSSFADALPGPSPPIHAGPSASFAASGEMTGRNMTSSSIMGGFAVASSSGTHQNAFLSATTTTTTTARPTRSGAHAVAETTDGDKFSMFLKRLHGNIGSQQKTFRRGLGMNSQQRHDAESASASASASAALASASASASTVQHRRPTPGIGRRVDTESDFMVEYLYASADPSSAAISNGFGSADGNSGNGVAGVGVGHHDKSSSLNPKAREFFSFTQAGPQDPAPAQAKAQAQAAWMARRSALSSLTSSSSSNDDNLNTPDGSGNPSPVVYANYYPGALDVVGPGPESGSDPTGLHLVPISLETFNPLRVVSTGDGDDGTSLIPLLPCVPPLAGGTCVPASGAFGDGPPVRPRPVPKPRTPDAKSQQEYEAWLEWRKAHEPGYAMACKARQQRRAQRKTGRANKGV
ncbi:hypothetical protein E4U42_007566 [Claviceps africana]|uniref:Uncharacterized protein n=1 Tax=Claviceps africana TaxID=83212 RepID=A0A8K0J1K1_9HYPO|nr:hypothetical protein E4U42_007566 [Claviceps africana]